MCQIFENYFDYNFSLRLAVRALVLHTRDRYTLLNNPISFSLKPPGTHLETFPCEFGSVLT